ncbi:MAG: hypothetical protein IPJ46_19375 [Anaerolineales bacterium]|nr:hypothetical protein [Anaerolineales bacterium]
MQLVVLPTEAVHVHKAERGGVPVIFVDPKHLAHLLRMWFVLIKPIVSLNLVFLCTACNFSGNADMCGCEYRSQGRSKPANGLEPSCSGDKPLL